MKRITSNYKALEEKAFCLRKLDYNSSVFSILVTSSVSIFLASVDPSGSGPYLFSHEVPFQKPQ